MTKRHWVVVGIGLTVAVVGIAIGAFVDVKLPNGINCGAPWGGSNALIFSDVKAACAEATKSSNVTSWVLTVVGVVVAAVGLLVGYLRPQSTVKV